MRKKYIRIILIQTPIGINKQKNFKMKKQIHPANHHLAFLTFKDPLQWL